MEEIMSETRYDHKIKNTARALCIQPIREKVIRKQFDEILDEVYREEGHYLFSRILERLEEQPWTTIEKIYISMIYGMFAAQTGKMHFGTRVGQETGGIELVGPVLLRRMWKL
jgi:hypothetical protein